MSKILESGIAAFIAIMLISISLTLTFGLELILVKFFGLTLDHLLTALLGVLAVITVWKEV
jgi:hypothetical protein